MTGSTEKRYRATIVPAFTLVELLVVLAIVAILMSILMPSLAGARRQARQLVCRNNLRSMFTGVLMYAQDHNEHAPLIEPLQRPEDDDPAGDPDGDGPPDEDPALSVYDYDPFDPERPLAVGNVLAGYVEPDSWVCPAAVSGYPKGAGRGRWTLTYGFRTAQRDADGELVPFVDPGLGFLGDGGMFDPVITNYSQFDGRPLHYLDGRRYVFLASGGGAPIPNYNYERLRERYWSVRWPLMWDALGGVPSAGRPLYPHRGRLAPRSDLADAEPQFKINTNYASGQTGYLALFADGDATQIHLTRDPAPHQPGI